MKKIVIIIALLVLALALAIPLSVKAFSASGLWNKVFKDFDPVAEDMEYEPLDEAYADEKYAAWLNAYESGILYGVINSPQYLYFTNAEINYILEKRLADLKNPPCDNFEIWFKDGNYAYLKAHLTKYLPGNVSGEVEFVKKHGRTIPQVRKAKWGKVRIPAFIANSILNREFEDLFDFMYSNPDFPNIKVEIMEDYLELEFLRE